MPLLILRTLLEKKKAGFEELVIILKDNSSRGTVNKYLNELYDSGFITRKGRRGKYYLTAKGKVELKSRGKEKIQQHIDSAQKSYDEYMRNIIQLSQEGHAKILTKEEISKIKFPTPEGIPVELDKKGMDYFRNYNFGLNICVSFICK